MRGSNSSRTTRSVLVGDVVVWGGVAGVAILVCQGRAVLMEGRSLTRGKEVVRKLNWSIRCHPLGDYVKWVEKVSSRTS